MLQLPGRRRSVASLPPELLADIFRIVLAAARSSRPKKIDEDLAVSLPGHLYQCALLRITHVCPHWRTIAIRCRRLWTMIWPCQQHEDFVYLALERSRASPLEVYVPGECFEETEFVRGGSAAVLSTLFKTELHRIAVLECGGLSYRLLRRHFPLATTAAPALRRLHLEDGALEPWLWLRLPQVEDLHIACISETSPDTWRKFWANVTRGSLRRLAIGDGRFPSLDHTPSANDVLDLLRDMPQLETLVLSVGKSKAEGEDVRLPKLRELTVADDGTESADDTHVRLLRKLIVPSSTVLRTGSTTRKLAPHALALAPPMATASELRPWALHPGPLQSLYIGFRDPVAHGSVSALLAGDATPAVIRREGYRFHRARVESAAELRWCAEHFELEDVTALTLIKAGFCEEEMLDAVRRFCERLPNVRTVSFHPPGHDSYTYRSANVRSFMAEIAEGSMFPKLENREVSPL
ncbi:hypothetical protein PsYK624_057870 [Phanerochaete sordida]|uniref:F-box domain-containing protein n=1 Tax=Phanerochaete sordida TaxID=48140 RepID=A0A9P3LBP3_9APHY|nr:hypothetical protein PsYK624_057870 [Phanerochaete sordida]